MIPISKVLRYSIY